MASRSLVTVLRMKLYCLSIMKPHRQRAVTDKRLDMNYQVFSRPEECGVPLGCVLPNFICISDGSIPVPPPQKKKECLTEGHLLPRQQSSKAFNLRNCLCQCSDWLMLLFHINGSKERKEPRPRHYNTSFGDQMIFYKGKKNI